MEENFNVDNDRLKLLHELYGTLEKDRKGEVKLSDKEREQIIDLIKSLNAVEAQRYESDNNYSARVESAEIEAKNKKEVAEIEAKSKKEPWYKPFVSYVLPAALTVGGTIYVAIEKMNRYEAQHKIDQDWDIYGVQSNVSKETERNYKPYSQK